MGSQGWRARQAARRRAPGQRGAPGAPAGGGGPLGVHSGVITAERRRAKRAVIARILACIQFENYHSSNCFIVIVLLYIIGSRNLNLIYNKPRLY